MIVNGVKSNWGHSILEDYSVGPIVLKTSTKALGNPLVLTSFCSLSSNFPFLFHDSVDMGGTTENIDFLDFCCRCGFTYWYSKESPGFQEPIGTIFWWDSTILRNYSFARNPKLSTPLRLGRRSRKIPDKSQETPEGWGHLLVKFQHKMLRKCYYGA